MSSELEAMKERARAWWRKHTANPKLPYAFKPREWTDETVALFASAEIEKAVAGLDIRCNLCGEILKAGPRDISTIHVNGCQCVIEKAVAQAVEARTREIAVRWIIRRDLAEFIEHYNLQPKAEDDPTLCYHAREDRVGGNDFMMCRKCGVEWDYRK